MLYLFVIGKGTITSLGVPSDMKFYYSLDTILFNLMVINLNN